MGKINREGVGHKGEGGKNPVLYRVDQLYLQG